MNDDRDQTSGAPPFGAKPFLNRLASSATPVSLDLISRRRPGVHPDVNLHGRCMSVVGTGWCDRASDLPSLNRATKLCTVFEYHF